MVSTIMRLVREEEDMAEAEEVTPEGTPDAPVSTEAAAEPIDGPIVETAEDAAEDAGEPDVNAAILEALLFATHHPLTGPRLVELMDLKSAKPLRKAIKALNKSYEETGRSFRIEQVAGGYQLLTLPSTTSTSPASTARRSTPSSPRPPSRRWPSSPTSSRSSAPRSRPSAASPPARRSGR
jgi:hypothetical protein